MFCGGGPGSEFGAFGKKIKKSISLAKNLIEKVPIVQYATTKLKRRRVVE